MFGWWRPCCLASLTFPGRALSSAALSGGGRRTQGLQGAFAFFRSGRTAGFYSRKMDPQTYMDVATVVTKLKMYPYFDIAHYILMCIAVREDVLPQQAQGESSDTATFLSARSGFSTAASLSR